jgi:hypothetical protein
VNVEGLRVAVTSIVRHATENQFSGFLRVLDLEQGTVRLKSHIPESAHRADDPNPRGGFRGAKGIGATSDRLVFANSERLFVLDRTWQLVNDITHPWMGAIHDILAEDAGIWVTCTNCDLLLKMGWDGEVLDYWSWRFDVDLARAIGFRSPPRFNPTLDYRTPRGNQGGVYNMVHVNAVARGPDGLLLSFGRILNKSTLRKRRIRGWLGRGAAAFRIEKRRLPPAKMPFPAGRIPGSSFAVVCLRNGSRPLHDDGRGDIVLHQHGIEVPNHNVSQVADLLIYSDSNRKRIVAYDIKKRTQKWAVAIPESASFPRGLARVGEDKLLIGSQAPTALHTLDVSLGKFVSSFVFSGEKNESVFGITVLPDSFNDPPKELII